MSYVVLDTDVASGILRDRLPSSLRSKLVGHTLTITFVTLGELATLNHKDFEDFADHEGLTLIR